MAASENANTQHAQRGLEGPAGARGGALVGPAKPHKHRQSSAPAFAPLREDAPGRVAPSRGKVPGLDTEEARSAAMDAFVLGMHAASSTHVRQVKLTTVSRLLGLWGLAPHPLTVDKIRVLGAALKAGGYRTAESYLLLYRGEAVRRGELMSPDVAVTIADAKRSCNRGLGGPVRAMALPFARLALLPEEPDPWNAGGPVAPRNAVVAGSWFLACLLYTSDAADE